MYIIVSNIVSQPHMYLQVQVLVCIAPKMNTIKTIILVCVARMYRYERDQKDQNCVYRAHTSEQVHRRAAATTSIKSRSRHFIVIYITPQRTYTHSCCTCNLQMCCVVHVTQTHVFALMMFQARARIHDITYNRESL